jgi:outer membrane receptor protein involved in Fe transport
LVSLGVRYEHSTQWVRYWDDASNEKRSELNTDDFFPALNMKYNFNPANSLRLSASRTVTRPSFIEMAPFLYKESYGSSEIRGNENLKNGYNYNIDLRYEFFPQNSSDMFSITGYYKKLESPIERVQESSGGSAVHSFRNADNGMAAGVEIEIRKEIIKNLRFRHQRIIHVYRRETARRRRNLHRQSASATGASPYLINADLSYTPSFGEERRMSLAMMYNVQGPRIHSVGIYNLGNVEQQALHTFDFVGNYEFKNISCQSATQRPAKQYRTLQARRAQYRQGG